MPQSLSAVYLHLIFSTKNREPWLVDPVLCEETHALEEDFFSLKC
jgi:hypothetical protein